MRGYIDLHSHWVAGVDDGARSFSESRALLDALHRAGFDKVVATPHMRPGMFDNTKSDLSAAYERTRAAVTAMPGPLPELGLSSEHFFDDVVYQRLLGGSALPYPGEKAVLVEFPTRAFPARVDHRFFDLMRRGLRPVVAHPERYQPVWDDPAVLDPLLDGGAVLLLDVASLAGKYGRGPKKSAELLLSQGCYYAACSDAHKASDVDDVIQGITRLIDEVGKEEADFLLREGPRAILAGEVED
ncbi:MAG: CpsB/CapC family capsule biosynthesis tyrosine phosphatase [Byssovorax sp.]